MISQLELERILHGHPGAQKVATPMPKWPKQVANPKRKQVWTPSKVLRVRALRKFGISIADIATMVEGGYDSVVCIIHYRMGKKVGEPSPEDIRRAAEYLAEWTITHRFGAPEAAYA